MRGIICPPVLNRVDWSAKFRGGSGPPWAPILLHLWEKKSKMRIPRNESTLRTANQFKPKDKSWTSTTYHGQNLSILSFLYAVKKIIQNTFVTCQSRFESRAFTVSWNKVHIFWEGHKILKNFHCRFDHYYVHRINHKPLLWFMDKAMEEIGMLCPKRQKKMSNFFWTLKELIWF